MIALPNQSPSSRTPAPASVTRRSRVTNGHELFVGSGMQRWRRRLSDLIAIMNSDMGGETNTSEAEKTLIRKAAMLSLQTELIEQNWAENHDGVAPAKRLDEYQRTCSALRRILESLGLKRRAKDVTPSFGQLLREDAIRQQREDGAAAVAKREAFEQQQREQALIGSNSGGT